MEQQLNFVCNYQPKKIMFTDIKPRRTVSQPLAGVLAAEECCLTRRTAVPYMCRFCNYETQLLVCQWMLLWSHGFY